MSEELLRASSVTRRFGEFTAVSDVSMSVGPGEVVGLLGANGAGKTTLMRMLLGLLETSSGTVTVLGGPPDRERRRRIGYVPQNLGLYPDLTATENMRFVADAYGTPVPTLPPDLARYASALVGDLPLGAQRTLAFLIALSHDPEVLLLDEPTSGVDALSRSALWDTIRAQASAGIGVLVTTHYMQEAQQCDRLLLMSDGLLVGQGSEADIVGTTSAAAVRTEDWAAVFGALNAAGVPVILDGRDVRVADTPLDDVRRILADAALDATVEQVPATIEERMLVLARVRSEDAATPA